MTAAAPPARESRQPGSRAAAVPLRRLIRVTSRQHRTALLWTGLAVAVLAIALQATGVLMHEYAARHGPNWSNATLTGVHYTTQMQAFTYVLQFLPLLAGIFLGAPLLPREIENGTARLAWNQAASRTRWLLAQVLPVASLLALAAVGIGAEFGWWLAPFPRFTSLYFGAWSALHFNLSPPLLAGWVVFAFTLGVFLGAAIRRTLPAMAATLVCYGTLLIGVSYFWRMHYLAPLRRAVAVQFMPGGGDSFTAYWQGAPVVIDRALGWPDGRLLTSAQLLHPAPWLRLHHIVLWVSYQPASRYHTFQLIELGWLLAASALLVAAAIVLVRRRPA